MKVTISQDVLNLFQDLHLGLIYVENLKYKPDADKLAEKLLAESFSKGAVHFPNEEFSSNTVIAKWRNAFSQFKTKKGARCSLEALLKRVKNSGEIPSIHPLVDVYNSISIEYGVPCGAEDVNKIANNEMMLAFANGDELFLPLGEETSQPPYPNEIVYKDNDGAICRCLNWREAQRTMITDDTASAIFVIEEVDPNNLEQFNEAVKCLSQKLDLICTYDKKEVAILNNSTNSKTF